MFGTRTALCERTKTATRKYLEYLQAACDRLSAVCSKWCCAQGTDVRP